MTQPTTDNQPAADDRDSTKPRSRRLFWWLVGVFVFLVVSTLALIGYRIHRQYTILNLLGPIHEEGWLELESDYPNWVANLSGDHICGLEDVRMISVDDAPAEHLRLIKELNPEELYWNRSDESDRSVYRFPVEGGRQIKDMTRLKGLWLCDSRYIGISDFFDFVVSDEVLSEIARAPSLEVVRFDNVKLQGSPFSALAGSSTIQTIILDYCSYPEADLSQLKNLKSLKSLTLIGDRVKEKSILSLADLTQLEELTLYDTELSFTCIQRLQDLQNLQSLQINEVESLRVIRFSDFACLPNLITLDLSYTDFDDMTAQELVGAKQLESLDLRSTKITDQGLRSLHALNQLERLCLSRINVTDEALEKFKKAAPGCEVYKE